MSIFNFTNPVNGQPFEIKGPPGLSFDQAKAIFDKQVSAGSLVGFKKGDVLSAATQAADGWLVLKHNCHRQPKVSAVI
jgi:hypothetical protein